MPSQVPSPQPRGSPQAVARPTDPAGQLAMAHAEFLMGQLKQNVDHLAATNTLDPLVCRQLQAILASARLRPPPPPAGSGALSASKNAKNTKKELEGKQKWVHDVLADTSLLPTLVDTALSVSAGPLLTSDQRSAISELVAMSQKKVADAVTDPERQAAAQDWTRKSAKSAHTGLKGGLQTASENWGKFSQRRSEDAEAQRTMKASQRQLELELAREREQARRGFEAVPSASAGSGASSAPSLTGTSIGSEGPATASTACLPSQHIADAASDGVTSEAGAVTTTFSPWPGLLLTMTTVAASVDVDSTLPSAVPAPLHNPPPAPPHGPALPPKPSIHSELQPPPPRRDQTAPAPAMVAPVGGAPPPYGSPVPPPPQHGATGRGGWVPSSLTPGGPPP